MYNIMKIECIYTFENRPQEFINIPVNPSVFKSKWRLESLLINEVEEPRELVKISCCINTEGEDIEPPKWFMDCNGKFYFCNRY